LREKFMTNPIMIAVIQYPYNNLLNRIVNITTRHINH